MFARGVAAALLFTFATTAASAFDRLYVFGDSLVDSGIAEHVAPAQAPVSLYPSGRFTNGIAGRNFADYVGRGIGLGDAAPAVGPSGTFTSGTNFAVGGATTAFADGETRPDLLSEIQGVPTSGAANTQPYPYYYNAGVSLGATAPITSDSLVLIATGGNDIRNYGGGGVNAFVLGVDKALRDSLDALYALGARNFALVGVPDIGLIPDVNSNAAVAGGASFLSSLINQDYQSVAADYSARIGGDGVFRLVDIATLQAGLTARPADYGLDADKAGKSCLRDGGVAALATNCAGYLYYDTIHPTDAVHRMIGNQILAAIAPAPEPANWIVMIIGFATTGIALRAARGRKTVHGAWIGRPRSATW